MTNLKDVSLGVFLLTFAIRDLKTQRVLLMEVFLFALAGIAWLTARREWSPWYPAGIPIGLAMLAASHAKRPGIGQGDAWFFLALSFWLRVREMIFLLWGSLSLCALTGLGLMLAARGDRNKKLPLLVFVFLGWLLGKLLRLPV